MGEFFASGGQSIEVSASASVLPMNIQGWFPLGLTSWISLQSKGLSRVFSNTTVQKHWFFGPLDFTFLTEAENIKKRWQEYTEELYNKDLHDPDNHDDVITNLEPDILECEVKWALESITTKKASGGDGAPVELFQILKDDALKVLHSICQQVWKTQQWPKDWKRSVSFLSNPKERQCQRMLKLLHNRTHLTH